HVCQLNLPLLHQHFAGKRERLQSAQRIGSSLGFNVFRNQFIERWGIFILSESRRCNERHRNEKDNRTQMHVRLIDNVNYKTLKTHRYTREMQNASCSPKLFEISFSF